MAGTNQTRPERQALSEPSPLQRRILDFVATGTGHSVVEATAGSGKTTTLVQVAQLLPPERRACFLAFNRATAAELKSRLPAHVESTTIHALGRAMLVRSHPHLATATPDAGKYRVLALKALSGHRPRPADPEELATYLARLTTLCRLALAVDAQRFPPAAFAPEAPLVTPGPQPTQAALAHGQLTVAQVAHRHALHSPVTAEATAQFHALVPDLLAQGVSSLELGQVDFTDMLYAPLMLGLPPPAYDFVCVDEAQDLSPLTLALVMRIVNAGARALFVGDPQQAIYAFAGADSRSIQRITTATAATVLPLSVSFRCPTRHVALARRFSPAMQARPGAPGGKISLTHLDKLPRLAQPGDLIMSRVNAPLVGLQLRLAEVGTPARVLGASLAEPTLALARYLFGNSVPRGAGRLVAEHARDETRRLERQLLTSPALGQVLDISSQRHQALGLLLRKLAARHTFSFEDLERLAHKLLDGTPGGPPGNAPTGAAGNPAAREHAPAPVAPAILSTIHKAKGREAHRVFLLFPEELAPLPMGAETHPEAHPQAHPEAAADLAHQLEDESESNVLFVALTRAKNELVLVERSKGAVAARLAASTQAFAQASRQASAQAPALPSGLQQEPGQLLGQRWSQVLTLASVMSQERPPRRWWRLTRTSPAALPLP